MEYPDKVTSIAIQFAGFVARIQSMGITVSYHVGNHDPWHSSFFVNRLDGKLFRSPARRELCSRRAYLSHGDETVPRPLSGRIARYFMRNQLWYRAYTMILPSSLGQRIPAWVSRKYAGLEPRPATVQALRNAALEILDASEIDLVVFGHAHQTASELTASGQYVNSGSWLLSRSFIEIKKDSVRIRLFEKETG